MLLFKIGYILLVASFITLVIDLVFYPRAYLLLLGRITGVVGVVLMISPFLNKFAAYLLSIPLEENFVLIGLAIYTLCFLGVKLYMKDHKYNRTI